MRYILFLSALVLFSQSGALAQSYAESALIFSRLKPGGSARTQALGGSQVGLGGDYSSAFTNPAGLGKYNRSEISITPSIGSFGSEGTFLNFDDPSRDTPVKETVNKFQIPGFGLVFHVPSNKEDGAYVGSTFAITLSRSNDFNRSMTYRQNDYNGSIIDYFIDRARGSTTDEFLEGGDLYNDLTGLSYHNFLIGPKSSVYPDSSDTEYFTDVTSRPNVRENVTTKGAMNQWNFSYGGNIKDRIYFGAGIGLASFHYKSKKIYSEAFPGDEVPYGQTVPRDIFDNLRAEENLDIQGSAVNATFGVLGRPFDFFQIGIAYTTPTFYQLTETYDANLATQWNNYDYYGNNDPDDFLNDEYAETSIITSDYNLTIPSKFSAGVAFISKYGFITGDVDITNPSKTRYSFDTEYDAVFDDAAVNKEIRASATRTVNYRFGLEGRYSIFRLRAGYGVIARAYREDSRYYSSGTISGLDKITTISGGVGVRLKKFFIDFTLVRNSGDNVDYLPYTYNDGTGPATSVKNTSTNGLLTVGFTW